MDTKIERCWQDNTFYRVTWSPLTCPGSWVYRLLTATVKRFPGNRYENCQIDSWHDFAMLGLIINEYVVYTVQKTVFSGIAVSLITYLTGNIYLDAYPVMWQLIGCLVTSSHIKKCCLFFNRSLDSGVKYTMVILLGTKVIKYHFVVQYIGVVPH